MMATLKTRIRLLCWGIIVMYMTHCMYAIAENITIIAVVDKHSPEYMDNLRNSIQVSSLPNYDLRLRIVESQDNDSFGAMDQVCTKIQDGVSVILDLSTRYVTATVRSLAEAMGITHVSSVDPSYYERYSSNYNTSVNIAPPSSIMLRAIRDFVVHENLTNVGIFYDHTFNLDDKPKRLLQNVPAQHLYQHLAFTDAAISAQLAKIKYTELHNIFLACNDDNANRFLGKVSKEGMNTFKFNWYVLTKNATIYCLECKQKTSIIQLRLQTKQGQRNMYIDAMSTINKHIIPNSFEVAAAYQHDLVTRIVNSLKPLLQSGRWREIRYPNCYNFTSADPTAVKQAALLTNEIMQYEGNEMFGPITWYDNYGEPTIELDIVLVEIQDGERIKNEKVGNWSQSQRVMAYRGSIVKQDKKKHYRVITVHEPPFVFKDANKPLGDVNYYYNADLGYYYYGYIIDLMLRINTTMKFEFSMHEPPDGAYGKMTENGSWNGMIRELQEDRADIIAGAFSVMAEREHVVDFTVPFYDLVGITILMKKPKFEYSVFKFMSVLEEAVWGCIFSAFIIVSILMSVFDRYSPYSYQNNKESWDGEGDEPRIFTLKEGLWFCMTSLTPQGGGESPRALSGRLVAATWWVFGFIMIATYTANLAAFLTVSRLEQPIDSLDDLAKQFKTKYAPQESSGTETYFMRMAEIEDKFYTIWKSMSLNDSLNQVERAKLAVWDYPVSDKFTNMLVAMRGAGFPRNFSEAIDRIKHPKQDEEFAFIGDATQNKYATLTDCDLWEVGEEFSRKPYALAVQEGSLLKNELSTVILQLVNERVLEDLKTRWWQYNRTQCSKLEDESDGISIRNIGGVFLVIGIGIGLGLITLGFEYYWYKWRPGLSKNKTTNNANSHGSSSSSNQMGHLNLAYSY